MIFFINLNLQFQNSLNRFLNSYIFIWNNPVIKPLFIDELAELEKATNNNN